MNVFALVPSAALVGGANVTMLVEGEGFAAGSVVVFNGADLATTVVSPSLLSAVVVPGAIPAGRVPVLVRSAGGAKTRALHFTFGASARDAFLTSPLQHFDSMTGNTKATGATAGIPGAWTPSLSSPPRDAADAVGIVASPASAWTTGQFVQGTTAGAPGRMSWTGAAWVGGAAP